MATHVKSFPARIDSTRIRVMRYLARLDARFLRKVAVLRRRAGARLTVLADHAYRKNIRQVNRARRVVSHHYDRGRTPVIYTWEAVQLAIRAERAGSDRFAGGLTT